MTHGASTEEKRNGQRAGLKRLGLVLHLQHVLQHLQHLHEHRR